MKINAGTLLNILIEGSVIIPIKFVMHTVQQIVVPFISDIFVVVDQTFVELR